MKRFISVLLVLMFPIFLLAGCGQKNNQAEDEFKNKNWNDILKSAKGTTVNFYGWGGSEQTNKWLDNYLSKQLKQKYNIILKRVPMDIDDILNKMLGEKQADVKGTIDVVWINGENFYTAKKNSLLYGPFTGKLPNYKKYIDQNSKDVQYDFGYSIDGYEAPYGKAQFVMIYDTAKVTNAPKNYEELMNFIKANPGKFTYPAPPDFTGSAFVRNIIYDIVGYQKLSNMKPDKETVEKEIKPAIDYLKEIKPYLWNKGETYPSNISMLNNLYSEGQVLDTMSYNPNSVSQQIENGQFTNTSKSFLFEKGTVGNTNFLAIPFNAPNKAGAMAVINMVLSFDAQYSKYNPDVWGDLPVFDNNKLDNSEKEKLSKVKIGEGAIPQEQLFKARLPEVPADLVPIIEKVWMENIPNKK